MSFLKALSAEQVNAVMQESEESRFYFDDPQFWRPYGNRSKNWDTVGNQQTNPVGALVELVTNGIDALLLRKARESGIQNFRSAEAPQTMHAAVRKFFPNVVEGRIANLEPQERTSLAEKCLLIGVKRADRANSRYPTYTVVDFGDGQNPEDFPNTFLSLSERNKEGIPFVQGKFNMGSTGSLRFCTRSDIRQGHYKLILSKRPTSKYWGWTMLRVRKPIAGEALPVAEYFCPDGTIPKFEAPEIQAFGHEKYGVAKEGTVIRLYEFDVGGKSHQVDFGLYDALTISLIDCALPIRLYDFDAKPADGKGPDRKQGIAPRTFGGMNVVLRAEQTDGDDSDRQPSDNNNPAEWVHHVLEERHDELGAIRITATGVRNLKPFLLNQPARVFYTVNGQTHAFERASFLNTRVGLGDLRNNLLVNVVCDGMEPSALATIFMPDRERKANVELARMLEEIVINALKGDARLREYASEIRRRRATERIEDTSATKDFLTELVKLDPSIKDLFGLGTAMPEVSQVPGGIKSFSGKKFPTFLDPLNLRKEGGVFVKELPLGASRRIECGTDAENEYLSRIDSPGEVWSSHDPIDLPYSASLRNGTASFTIRTPKSAKLGDIVLYEFGFVDNGGNTEPLKFQVAIHFVAPEVKSEPGGSRNTNTKPGEKVTLALPAFEWVDQSDWGFHSFSDESGAYVSTGERTVVYLNRDNKFLQVLRVREKDESTRMLNENRFKYGLGILALSIHKKVSSGDTEEQDTENKLDPETVVRITTSAMAAHIVTVINRLSYLDKS
ncbi:MAG: hypothetical protein EAZ37_06000 [Burkholderiales bacterium]|nr:MAG: hypothetical protein EAZ37_06000 [Burkholderiales bacterium]